MQNCRNELNFLLVAFGQFARRGFEFVAKTEGIKELGDAFARVRCVHAVQSPEEKQLVRNLHFGIQTALFRKIAEGVAEPSIDPLAVPAHHAAVRRQDIQDHAKRRGLARTVWTKQTEDSSLAR